MFARAEASLLRIAQNRVKDLFLQPWQEAVGKCIQIATSETETTILLKTVDKTVRLHLPNIKKNLKPLKGQHIAILRTDIAEKPVLLRKVADIAQEATTEPPVHAHERGWR